MKYEVIPIEWDAKYEKEIAEVYRLLKDQEKKIFDLTWYDNNPCDLFDYIETMLQNGYIFVTKEDDNICGMFILEDIRTYKDRIISADVHTAIRRKYWGQQSRDICDAFIDYSKELGIEKLIAEVPQCSYGVIKLLKDIGFKHCGTVPNMLMYKNKNNEDKLYDGLIYSLELKGE